jgi:transcription initiation factor TFIIIB Brf1 subunit/transcription initiation factor TFIIB
MRRTAHGKETTMSCSKDKPIRKAKRGEFRCKDCGVVAKKKKNLCSPKKVKD